MHIASMQIARYHRKTCNSNVKFDEFKSIKKNKHWMYCEFSLSFLANSVSSVCLESEFNIPLATRAAAVASYDENVKIDKSGTGFQYL